MDVEALAAPTISAVSGSLSDGSTVTISGSNFGTKNPAKPLIWADFETSLNPTNLGTVTTWNSTENFTRVTSGAPVGSGMAEGASNQTAWTMRVNRNAYNAYNEKTYIYMLARKNFSVSSDTSQNWKVLRFWASGTTPPDFYCGRDAWITENCPPSKFFAARDFSANTWVNQEFALKANSTLNAADATAFWYVDADRRGTTSLVTRCTGSDVDIVEGFVVHFVAANIASWVNPAWSTTNQVWVDNVYVDTTWARVMIGNAATFAASTQREIQIPSAWSDSSIAITLNLGTFANLNSAFLYVIDASGTPNATGFFLGGPQVAVPDVVGLTQADAQASITAAGLVVGNVMIAASATVPVGVVISQVPIADTPVSQGSEVDLVVSGQPSSSGGGGGGCFIATAAYGSPLAKEVHVLREFRDRYLLSNDPGRLFVDQYYRFSPPLANAIAASEARRALARGALRPVVWWADLALTSPILAFGSVGAGGVALPLVPFLVYRRMRSRSKRSAPAGNA